MPHLVNMRRCAECGQHILAARAQCPKCGATQSPARAQAPTGRCLRCHRGGLFIALTGQRLCTACAAEYQMTVPRQVQIIVESLILVRNSKKLDTRLNRIEDVRRLCTSLLAYEHAGVATMDPPPSEILASLPRVTEEVLLQTLHVAKHKAEAAASSAATDRARVTALTRYLTTIRELLLHAPESSTLRPMEREAVHAVSNAFLQMHLNAARKAELKGQSKRALDAYYEALYYLRHDDIDDRLQAQHITQIETRIAALGGFVDGQHSTGARTIGP